MNLPTDVLYPKMCPRFDRCSVNCCPLDIYNEYRPSVSGDPERTCLEHISTRLAVVEKAKSAGIEIPGGGWSRAERENWPTLEALIADWDRRKASQKASGERLRMARGVENPVAPQVEPLQEDAEVEEGSE